MRIVFFSLVLLTMVACKKETGAPETVLMEMVETSATLISTGNFQNGPYGSVSGSGSIYRNADGSFSIRLEGFKTSNGPDLFVYLSKEKMPVTFIEAGKLKSTNGNQVYTFQAPLDLPEYKYICIHCKKFNHLFGYAELF
jgi:hypothetical protein